MRPFVWLSLLLVGGTCRAWDTTPHQKITRAALDSLPAKFVNRLGPESKLLIDLYCIYPDRYQEMAEFGFTRKSAGPQDASEVAVYCVRPDGEAIHGATGDWQTDAGSLVYVFERILSNLAEHRPQEAARFAGVLSHFIADTLSPPHSAPDEHREFHAVIERSAPDFTLRNHAPRLVADHLLPAAKSIFDQLYAGAAANRKDLPAMVNAAGLHDEQLLDTYRLRAARRAAEIFADALFTLFTMSDAAHAEPRP
jgi:hypothetical protein